MKREILFRGFNEKNSKWLYGYYFVNRGQHFVADDEIQTNPLAHWTDFEVDPDTIGQYTGLKDKNRKKIFEWDILFQGQELLGVVCISKRYGVSILKKATTWSLINFVLDSDFDAGVLSDIEVRGNVTDNPELMK